MVPVIVILTIIVFILVDVITRLAMKRHEERKLLKEREEALDIGLRLEFTGEAKSLKRVEVKEPKARILAVDDEPVILDSFRKILVLHGYSVDTVETGKEAVGLVKRNDYDFVFTDLKMPEFDGLEVTKAVKHLRPDIDVIMITGYGTIESAVASMQYGAMDYVEKPFTEDELVGFVTKSFLRRQARLEREIPPKFHLVTVGKGESDRENIVNVAGGLFVTAQHTWLNVAMTGEVKVGVDDFCVKSLREIDDIILPEPRQTVKKGEALFTLKRNSSKLTFASPLSGQITRVNSDLAEHLELLTRKPFNLGWICCMDTRNLSEELRELKLGAEALDWYEQEVAHFREKVTEVSTRREQDPGKRETELDELWEAFEHSFLKQESA